MNKTGHSQRSSARSRLRGQHTGSIGLKLICLALGMLLSAGSAQAGFDDTWWTAAGPGWTSATDRPVASNLVSRQWTEVWTQTSSTNYIPAITWENRYFYWVFSEWIPERSTDETTTDILYPNSGVFGWNGDFSISVLSHYPGIGASNTTTRSWTNQYLEYPRPDISSTLTSLYDTVSYALSSMDSYTGGTGSYSYVWTNSSISVTTDLSVTVSPSIETLYMSTADAVAYDSYRALAERWAIVQGDHNHARTGITDAYKPVMGQRGDVRNLQRAKTFLAALLPLYVDPYLTNDFTEAFGTNYASIAAWSTFAPTATGLCAELGIPTNYFEYVPPQLYSMPNSKDLGRVVTNTYTMVCTGTTACANSVIDFEHDTRALIGTNGQVMTFLSTNENIMAGYTMQDYGYKHIPSLVTNGLRWIGGGWTEDSVDYDGAWNIGNTNDFTWADAKANGHQTNGFTFAVGNWSYGSTDGTNYFARWYSSEHTLTLESATNIEAEVDVYMYADATPFLSEPFDWNDDTYTNLVESRMALIETTNTTSSTVTVIVSSTNQPTWCDAPTGTGTNATGRGARLNLGKQRALFRYDGNFDNE